MRKGKLFQPRHTRASVAEQIVEHLEAKHAKQTYSEEFLMDYKTAIQYLSSSEAPRGPFHIEELYKQLDLTDVSWSYKGDLVEKLTEDGHLHSAGPLMVNGYLTSEAQRRIQQNQSKFLPDMPTSN